MHESTMKNFDLTEEKQRTTPDFIVTISAERLAKKGEGGSNTMDIDPGLINITLAHFAS